MTAETLNSVDARVYKAVKAMGLDPNGDHAGFRYFLYASLLPPANSGAEVRTDWDNRTGIALDMIIRSVLEARSNCQPHFAEAAAIPPGVYYAIARRDLPRDGNDGFEIQFHAKDAFATAARAGFCMYRDFAALDAQRMPSVADFAAMDAGTRMVTEVHAVELARRTLLANISIAGAERDRTGYTRQMNHVMRYRPLLSGNPSQLAERFRQIASILMAQAPQTPWPALPQQIRPDGKIVRFTPRRS